MRTNVVQNETIRACCRCLVERPVSDFSRSKNRRGGLHPLCKVCRAAYYAANKVTFSEKQKARHLADPEKFRAKCRANYRARRQAHHGYAIKKNYGITAEQYAAMLEKQGGVCAICGKNCASGQRLAVDHCHQTGTVRGLLCGFCNRGVGNLQDSPELLRSAAMYLETHSGT